jgi:hypothetical protein
MYGGAAFLGIVESLMPGGPSFSIAPGLAALALAESDPALPSVRTSVGVADAVAPVGVEELLQPADSASYAAARAGRDRTVVNRRAATGQAALAASGADA